MAQPVKGTYDLFDKEASQFSNVESLMSAIAELYSFKEIRLPVMEYTELFVRGVGESSDVVRKEMYTFPDKANRSVTLRPEFTAGIMRSIVSNKLYATQELPIKVFYNGPVFRYDRPQLGRYRQFNQFGVECVGCNDPLCDVEVISLAYTILVSLGLKDVTLKINTLGDDASRNAYKVALKDFFKDKVANMCPDCQNRYEINPLRILDCKVPEDQEIVKGAPKMNDYLSVESRKRFEYILGVLDDYEIPYEVDDGLVRGLDYYAETVFEFHYVSSNGNNYGAIGGGGHYDKLLKEVGGPDYPGVGFSFGIERILSVLKDDELLKEDEENKLKFYVMPMGEEARKVGLDAANALRTWGFKTDVCFENCKLPNMFKRAEKKGADFAIIIGDDEIKTNTMIIKDLEAKTQISVNADELLNKAVELYDEREHDECDCGCGCGHHHHHDDCCCCDDDDRCCCDDDCCCDGDCCCGEGKHKCGHKCGEFPCKTDGVCPCGKDPQECECILSGTCMCKCKEEK